MPKRPGKNGVKNKIHSTQAKAIQVHDQILMQGLGGDTHVLDKKRPALTTQIGAPIADDANSLKGGMSGPTLLEDFILRDKIFHFDHERIPERVVHARGFGAHGFFESYESLSSITSAHLFQRKGEKTPAFVRFSTVAGSKGSPDLARDVRGFAVKLYTKEGNWDIVGNNIPVFFIQDAMKFPDLIHAAKDEPDRGFPQAQTAHDNFWDFVSLTPESMHMIMWVMSDRGIPRSFRFMEGFGVHTFRFVNEHKKSTFVKFHWKPKQGMQSVTWDEAVKINGADPDYHRRDLWNAIKSGDFPEWELGVQLFDEAFAEKFPFDVLDATKLIPEELIPIKIVGRLILNRCVDNFAETEQVAFCTQNIVPGIDFSNDPLLQGRNFSYLDTQLKRLGSPNFQHLPINAPKCPFAHFQQDGHMTMQNPKGRVNYNPNSWGAGPIENPLSGFSSLRAQDEGAKMRMRPEKFADHYSQARQFYISQTNIEQKHIADALVFELSKVEKADIRVRMVAHLMHIEKSLASMVAEGLGLKKMPKAAECRKKTLLNLKPSAKLSILQNILPTFKGRRLGVLVADGTDAPLFRALQKAAKKEGVTFSVIAPTISGVVLSDGEKIAAEDTFAGAPSVLFDAVVILLADLKFIKKVQMDKVAAFIKDAHSHAKYIAYTDHCATFFDKLSIQLDNGMLKLKQNKDAATFLVRCRDLRFWERMSA